MNVSIDVSRMSAFSDMLCRAVTRGCDEETATIAKDFITSMKTALDMEALHYSESSDEVFTINKVVEHLDSNLNAIAIYESMYPQDRLEAAIVGHLRDVAKEYRNTLKKMDMLLDDPYLCMAITSASRDNNGIHISANNNYFDHRSELPEIQIFKHQNWRDL